MVVLRRGLLGDFQFPGWRSLVVRGPGVRSWDSMQGSLGFSHLSHHGGRYALWG